MPRAVPRAVPCAVCRTQAEDWEHEGMPDDDDEDMGHDDKFDDDPGGWGCVALGYVALR